MLLQMAVFHSFLWPSHILLYVYIYIYIYIYIYTTSFFFFLSYLFLAALGLCCCVRAFSSCGEQGLLLVAVRGLLIAVASLVVEHGF